MDRKRLVAPICAAVVFALVVAAFWVWIVETQELSIITWLGSLPVILIFAIVGVFWVVFALIAWWIGESTLSPDDRDVTHENVSRFLVIMTSFFVFVLGFVISQEWSNSTAARNDISSGAAGLYTANYNARPLPRSTRNEIEVSLSELGLSILCEDLPTLDRTGRGAPQTHVALVKAFNAVTKQPVSIQAYENYDDVVDALGSVSESRRQWLGQADNALPTVVLVSIFIASGLLLGAFVVQSTRSRRGHLATVIGLALLITLGTGMVISLARPFAGAAKINPDTFSQNTWLYNRDCSELDRIRGLRQ